MSDDTIDIRQVNNANNQSKITENTKKRFADLANQVKLWQEDDLEFINKPVLEKNITSKKPVYHKPLHKSPPNDRRATLKDSHFRNSIKGSVKKLIGQIESKQTESPININLPRKKIIQPSFLLKSGNYKPKALLPTINKSQVSICSQIESNNPNTDIVNNSESAFNSPESQKTEDFKMPECPQDHSNLIENINYNLSIKDDNESESESLGISVIESSNLESADLDDEFENNDKENSEPLFPQVTENNSISRISDSITHISFSNDEIGLYKEFEMECLQLSEASRMSSVKNCNSSDRTRLRRSFSYNDKVEVNEPIPDEDSDSESESLHNEEEQTDNSQLDQIPPFQPQKTSSILNIQPKYTDRSELLQRELTARECMQFKVELLHKLLKDSEVELGGEEHLKICKDMVKTKLLMKTLALEKANLNTKSSIIEGDLEIKDLILGFKPNFVIVDFKNPKLLKNWNKIRSIQHLLICVYVEDRSNIFTSDVLTLIEVNDAEKYSIQFDHPHEQTIINAVNLNGIQPKSRLVFDVFCLNVQPVPKPKKSTSTPIKKFFSRYGSVDKVNTVPKSTHSNNLICNLLQSPKPTSKDNVNHQPRSLHFTNIMTFEMSLCGVLETFVTFSDHLNVTKHSLLTGDVFFRAKMNLKMNKTIEGKLNVYSDMPHGIGNWTWYNCQVTPAGIEGIPCGGSSIIVNDPSKRVFIPWAWCSSLATSCPSWVCLKPRTMSIEITNAYIDDENSNNHTPVNRRTSTDGKLKRRFLFEASSDEEQNGWCEIINDALTAYHSFRN